MWKQMEGSGGRDPICLEAQRDKQGLLILYPHPWRPLHIYMARVQAQCPHQTWNRDQGNSKGRPHAGHPQYQLFMAWLPPRVHPRYQKATQPPKAILLSNLPRAPIRPTNNSKIFPPPTPQQSKNGKRYPAHTPPLKAVSPTTKPSRLSATTSILLPPAVTTRRLDQPSSTAATTSAPSGRCSTSPKSCSSAPTQPCHPPPPQPPESPPKPREPQHSSSDA